MLDDLPQSTPSDTNTIPLQSANGGDVLNMQNQQSILVSGGAEPSDTTADYTMFIVFALVIIVAAVGIYMALPRTKKSA